VKPKFLVQKATARGRSRIGTETNLRPRITAFNLAAWGWGAILLLAVGSADAQRLTPRFATLPEPFAESAARPSAAAVAFGHPDDYRWEGLLVGGIGLGLFGTYLAVGLCCDPDSGGEGVNTVLAGLGGFLVGGFLGGVTGGLLGGLIPKEKP